MSINGDWGRAIGAAYEKEFGALPDIIGSPGTFTLTEINPPTGERPEQVWAWATSAPIVTAGYGGWSRVARPRKKALTEWVGRDSMSIEIEFLIDVFCQPGVDNPGMLGEKYIRALERMAGVDRSDPEPPMIMVTSTPPKLVPHNERRATHVSWFVESLAWDRDSIIVLDSGNRVRAGGSVVITQHVADERLTSTSAQKRRGATSVRGATRNSYTVKEGDTLSQIAARKDVYGDASKWKLIAKANKIRDPKNLKVGKELKIP